MIAGQVENKDSLPARAYAFLDSIQTKHTPGSTTFYLRRDSSPDPRFLELDLELVRFLEAEGILKMTENDYMREGAVDPNIITLHLEPKGQEILRSRVTTTTQTVTETFQEPEEPAWKQNKRYRNLARTERGGAILSASPEALASDIRGHIEVLKRGGIPRGEWKARQIWLRYWLLYRGEEIPENLRHEAEDFRDLPFTSRHKQRETERHEMSSDPLEPGRQGW